MKLNDREIKFLRDFNDNFNEYSIWSLNKIILHFKLSKAFIYNLLNKLGFSKWKEFLLSISNQGSEKNISANTEIESNIIDFVNSLKEKKLFICGEGYSKISGNELLYFINKFKNDCSLVEIKREWTWKFLDEKMSNSVFLIYSSKGKNLNILNFLKYISSLDNNTIFCITENTKNIYKDYVDYFIYSKMEILNSSYYLNEELSPIIPQIFINHEIKKIFLSKK